MVNDLFMYGTGLFAATTVVAMATAKVIADYRDDLIIVNTEMLHKNLRLAQQISERNAKIAQFEAEEKKRQDQRKRASLVAAAKRHEQALKRHAEEDPARRQKTIDALAATPLRPRDAVVAPVREKRAARA